MSKKPQYAKPVSNLLYCGSVHGFGFSTNKIEFRTSSFIKFSIFMQVNEKLQRNAFSKLINCDHFYLNFLQKSTNRDFVKILRFQFIWNFIEVPVLVLFGLYNLVKRYLPFCLYFNRWLYFTYFHAKWLLKNLNLNFLNVPKNAIFYCKQNVYSISQNLCETKIVHIKNWQKENQILNNVL